MKCEEKEKMCCTQCMTIRYNVCVCVCEREYGKTGELIIDPKSAILFPSWTTNQSVFK